MSKKILGLTMALIIPTVLILIGGFYFWNTGFLIYDLITFLVFYQLSLFGLSVAMHRYFAHKSFQTSQGFEILLFILGSSVLQYSPLFWASFHRKHHHLTDKKGDPHSPWQLENESKITIASWMHSHFLWGFSFDFQDTTEKYSPDWLARPHLVFLHRYHYFFGIGMIFIAGIFEMLLMGHLDGFLRGLYFGGVFRIFVLHNFVFLVNSILGHGFGYRRFHLDDKSTNNIFLFPFLLGEAWHNNHHHNPSSAKTQVGFFEWDPHFLILKLLNKLGVIWSLRK